MIVAGGIYTENCASPRFNEIFGSGGRAAVALSSLGITVELHGYSPATAHSIISASLEGADLTLKLHESPSHIAFSYLHPLARPEISPWPVPKAEAFSICGPSILRFGMIEGDAVVDGDLVVFDPQSPEPEHFGANGSVAVTLSIVLNSDELRAAFPGAGEADAIAALTTQQNASILIVKDGPAGARVYSDGSLVGSVPPYESKRVYKIGSGDIFSAAFAAAWAVKRLGPLDAADYASRSVARYCETHLAQLQPPGSMDDRQPINAAAEGLVYLAAPFFTTSDIWLVEEIHRCFRSVGAGVFSPLHEIGFGPAKTVAPADLDALKRCTAILAVISERDVGTVFEAGYGVANNIPVVVLAETNRPFDLTMLEGSDCEVARDIATAVYRATWASRR